jgi:hypothetical protein
MWQISSALQNEVTSKKKLRAYVINSWNSFHYYIHNILSSRFIYKNLKIKIYKTIILLVPHGCETWSVVSSEERRLKVPENRVLRRIFVHKREEVAGDCRRLHNDNLNNLYVPSKIIRKIKSWRVR